MTAKELLLERAPSWTEQQAAAALRAADPELQLTVTDAGAVEQDPIPTLDESIAILASVDFPPRGDAWR